MSAGLNLVGTLVTLVNPLSLLFLFTRVALLTTLLLTVALVLALFLCAAVGTVVLITGLFLLDLALFLAAADNTTGFAGTVFGFGGGTVPLPFGAGVYFVRGSFVQVQDETIVLSQYSNTPSARIGLRIDEDIINADEDETLELGGRRINIK